MAGEAERKGLSLCGLSVLLQMNVRGRAVEVRFLCGEGSGGQNVVPCHVTSAGFGVHQLMSLWLGTAAVVA